jgi:uncharacterized protein (DUF2236 family)
MAGSRVFVSVGIRHQLQKGANWHLEFMEPKVMQGTCDENKLHRDCTDSEATTEETWVCWVAETTRDREQVHSYQAKIKVVMKPKF